MARRLPRLTLEVQVQPITRSILRLSVDVIPDFEFVERWHGHGEAFWLWVEDNENDCIYHTEYVVVNRPSRQRKGGREWGREDTRHMEFTIPVREPLPAQYFIRVVSDSWVGCESVLPVSFQSLILPSLKPSHTDLLDMHPVPVQALGNKQFESLYDTKFSHFNPIQTQTFHTLYNSDKNVLVGAPTGSGKTITAELALLRLLKESPGAKTIYVAPLKVLLK